MLARQAQITRGQVGTFREAMSTQRTSRSEIRNGTVGPWVILLVIQVLSAGTILGQLAAESNLAPNMRDFFFMPLGMGVAFVCAMVTIGMYAWAMKLAGRGLLLERVPTEYGATQGG